MKGVLGSLEYLVGFCSGTPKYIENLEPVRLLIPTVCHPTPSVVEPETCLNGPQLRNPGPEAVSDLCV